MPQPNWPLFALAALAVTLGLLVLSRASARLLRADGARGHDPDGPPAAADREEIPASADEPGRAPPALPPGALLYANLALTHGLVVVAVLALGWGSGVPVRHLGVGPAATEAVATGAGLGLGLYLASEAATGLARRLGFDPDERLRALLAPGDAAEWALLVLVVLPVVALGEELLFRGVLVGALAAGFDVPVSLLVVGSSALFGLGHSAQGGLGVLVTATLGLVLGAAFVATGDLLVVVLAHYTVDVLEFAVREGVLNRG